MAANPIKQELLAAIEAERVRVFREARRLWAITLVERTGDLVNNARESRDSIAKVRDVAAHNRWQASKRDRELFGEDKGDVNVNVSGRCTSKGAHRYSISTSPHASVGTVALLLSQAVSTITRSTGERLRSRLLDP